MNKETNSQKTKNIDYLKHEKVQGIGNEISCADFIFCEVKKIIKTKIKPTIKHIVIDKIVICNIITFSLSSPRVAYDTNPQHTSTSLQFLELKKHGRSQAL